MKKLYSLFFLSSLSFASGFLGGSGSGGGSGASIGGVVTSGTQYSVLFIDPTATLAQDPTKLGYDVTNTRFCIGCNVSTSTKTFHLLGTAQFESLSTGLGHFDSSGNLTSSLLVNADVSASAAIAYSKLALSNSIVAADIFTATITNAKLADMTQSTIKGRAVGAGTGVPTDLTATQATAVLNVFGADSGSGGVKGLVPATVAGDALKYLKGDGTWATLIGSGTVTSVDFSVPATSIFSVSGNPVTTSGTIALATTGTSGGIPYFSSTSKLSSSALLTANALVLGGGAGAAPAPMGSLGTTTTLLHGNAAGAPTFAAVSLTADVTGILPLANGGSNKNMTAVNGGVVWTDADSMEVIAAGTSGQILQSNGAAAPTWVPVSPATPTIFGSRGTPRSIVAATGITTGASHMSNSSGLQKIYVEGSVTGDSVVATISAGTIDGQEMVLQGRNNLKTITLDSTTTNVIVNGSITLGQDETARLTWDTTNWVVMSRSN